jgi:hypothetical protein
MTTPVSLPATGSIVLYVIGLDAARRLAERPAIVMGPSTEGFTRLAVFVDSNDLVSDELWTREGQYLCARADYDESGKTVGSWHHLEALAPTRPAPAPLPAPSPVASGVPGAPTGPVTLPNGTRIIPPGFHEAVQPPGQGPIHAGGPATIPGAIYPK